MKLSLAITTFNRYEMTVESFAQVIDDPRITDILILDDASTDGSFEKLVEYFKNNSEVKVTRQAQNRGMSRNKRDAISLVQGPWVIIWDSDNILGKEYLDALEYHIKHYWELEPNCIYIPSFAKPAFDYRKYEGCLYDQSVLPPVHEDAANCMMNTCNYVVNQTEYLKVYQHDLSIKGTDTVWFNYLWLKAGNSFYVIPGMEYHHRIHDGSGFLQDADYNMKKSAEVRKLIMQL
jgi:glycosyltransferase involved in cell wall biosynthesis